MEPLTPQQIELYAQSRTAQYTAGMIICLVLVVVSTTMRYYSQFLVGTLGALDNWLIGVASVWSVCHRSTQ
jgi:hypothetical protein